MPIDQELGQEGRSSTAIKLYILQFKGLLFTDSVSKIYFDFRYLFCHVELTNEVCGVQQILRWTIDKTKPISKFILE